MTSQEINELPERVRRYIHHLVADCDPSGTLRENFHLKEQNEALQRMIDDERHEFERRIYLTVLASASFPNPIQQINQYVEKLIQTCPVR